jgi:hypothetical protein
VSRFLLVGFADETGAICLAAADPRIPDGSRLF